MALVEAECKSFYVKNADNKTKKIDFQRNFKEVIGKKFKIDVDDYTFEHYDGKFNLSLEDDEDFSNLSSDSLINIVDKNNDSDKKKSEIKFNDEPGKIVLKGERRVQVSGNYIDGDKITANEFVKVRKNVGALHIGGMQKTVLTGNVSGEMLHFGIGRNIKMQQGDSSVEAKNVDIRQASVNSKNGNSATYE